MTRRIAIVGLSVEALITSPIPTGIDGMQIHRGEAILHGDLWLVRGALDRLAKAPGYAAVPLIWATALPGGALTADCYAAIKSETMALLESEGPFDGVVVANHGALEVAGLGRDADTDYLAAVRAVVGPGVPVAVALDLHGDMSEDMLRAATVFSALRTAPHRDDRETGYRAADQLVRVIEENLAPACAMVAIPILIAGEYAVTTTEPAKSLYEGLAKYDARDGVLDANILVGFAFNDRPWTGMAVMVTTRSDRDAAVRYAEELAAEVWAKRREFTLKMETADVREGLERAVRSKVRPVYVSDSGDNTTAGAPGDLTLVLQAAIELAPDADIIVAGITAPSIVRKCMAAGRRATIDLELDQDHISRARQGMHVAAVVEDFGEALELGGFQPYRSKEGAWARVRIAGTLATFHDNPVGITTPAHLEAMGISPTAHAVYVVKLGYLHPQLEPIAQRHILLLSDGAVPLDPRTSTWREVRRPMYPLEGDMAWSPIGVALVN
jgi:microcystin degradation protein MlrC